MEKCLVVSLKLCGLGLRLYFLLMVLGSMECCESAYASCRCKQNADGRTADGQTHELIPCITVVRMY